MNVMTELFKLMTLAFYRVYTICQALNWVSGYSAQQKEYHISAFLEFARWGQEQSGVGTGTGTGMNQGLPWITIK